ncbi:MAG: hypothetical protein O2924_01845 [Chloroflexi bacterium]|nr:hypothetical protein [Chloroflexota bacterium]
MAIHELRDGWQDSVGDVCSLAVGDDPACLLLRGGGYRDQQQVGLVVTRDLGDAFDRPLDRDPGDRASLHSAIVIDEGDGAQPVMRRPLHLEGQRDARLARTNDDDPLCAVWRFPSVFERRRNPDGLQATDRQPPVENDHAEWHGSEVVKPDSPGEDHQREQHQRGNGGREECAEDVRHRDPE